MKFSKRLTAFFLFAFMLITLVPSTQNAQARAVLNDVPDSYAYKNAIYKLFNEGIMDATKQSGGVFVFNPGEVVPRADAVKLVVSTFLESNPDELEVKSLFSDVPEDYWANRYITYAAESKIISPKSDGTFAPYEPVTYGEVVKMLVCARGYASTCRETNPWYDGYISVANQIGINDNVYYTDGNAKISRGLLAQLIYNAKYSQKIPKLHIYGDISGMASKSDVRNIHVKYENGHYFFESYATLKVQGTSSLAYSKKNFTIQFFEDSLHTKKRKIDVGWGKESKYCLKANWIDKSHARNVVSAKLVTQMQSKYNLLTQAPRNGAVDGFPVEIYNNDQFHGIYTFNIPKDDWMFGMDGDNPDHIVVGGEDWGPETLFEARPNFSMWEVEVGEDDDATLEKLTRMFDFVINSSDEEFRRDFNKYLNLDAVMNYYVFADCAYLIDNLGKNMMLATYDGKIWYPSLYDLDSSWGVQADGKSLFGYEQNLVGFDYNNLFHRVEKCFKKELSQRYFELRQDVLSKNNIMFNFKSFDNAIPKISFAKEMIKWGTEIPGYDTAQLERYLDNILPRLDKKYSLLSNLTLPSDGWIEK